MSAKMSTVSQYCCVFKKMGGIMLFAERVLIMRV